MGARTDWHCPDCEVGWRAAPLLPSRCPDCGEMGVQGDIMSKFNRDTNRARNRPLT